VHPSCKVQFNEVMSPSYKLSNLLCKLKRKRKNSYDIKHKVVVDIIIKIPVQHRTPKSAFILFNVSDTQLITQILLLL
jgi:hypothetical protein